MRVHIRLILTLSFCQAREILFNENLQRAAVVEDLLARHRDLLRARPGLHGRLGQSHGHNVRRQEDGETDARRAALDAVTELSPTRKAGCSRHDPGITEGLHFRSRQAQPN